MSTTSHVRAVPAVQANIDAYAPIPSALRAEGIDPRRVLAAIGLDPDAPVGSGGPPPHEITLRLLEHGLRALGDGFAVRAAERVRLDAFGVLGFACLTAPYLGSALAQEARYRRLLFDGGEFALELEGDPCRIVRAPVPSADRFALGARGLVELGLAEHVGALREITGEELAPLEVRFAHPSVGDTREHARFFRAPLLFGAARHEVIFPRRWLALPSRHAHPGLSAFFDAAAREALGARTADTSVAARVRELLAADLRDGVPSARKVARRLGTSERTLTRRLAEEGTSLPRLLDEVRRALALRYLGDERLSVGEIAFLLGFSEASAFHRAFKRLTGRRVAEVRRESLRRHG